MLDTVFGEGQTGLKVFLFVIVVLALLALAFWLVRRFAGGRLGGGATRGRQPRLAVIDQATVDSRRRLVLIRRDNVEHLLIIGGPSDVVVEPNIVRAATAVPETGPRRPPAMPRAPFGEDSTRPLQPEPAPPGAPAARKARTVDRRAEGNVAPAGGWRVEAAGGDVARRAPAPPVRSTAEATLKSAPAETAQPPAPPRKARTADPLAKLAPMSCRACRGLTSPPSNLARRRCNRRRRPEARPMRRSSQRPIRTSPRSRSGSRPHYAAPRRARRMRARPRVTRARQVSRLRPSPQRHQENRRGRAAAMTRPPASPQRRRESRTRRTVAMTGPRANPQRRRESRTRRAVTMTGA